MMKGSIFSYLKISKRQRRIEYASQNIGSNKNRINMIVKLKVGSFNIIIYSVNSFQIPN